METARKILDQIGRSHPLEEGSVTICLVGALLHDLAGAGVGNVDNGAHSYVVTFGNENGETEAGDASNAVNVVDKTAWF